MSKKYLEFRTFGDPEIRGTLAAIRIADVAIARICNESKKRPHAGMDYRAAVLGYVYQQDKNFDYLASLGFMEREGTREVTVRKSEYQKLNARKHKGVK